MSDLSFDDILAADDCKMEAIVVKEWKDKDGNPGTVYIKQMTGREQGKWEKDNRDKDGGPKLVHMRASMVAACLVNAKGERICKDEDAVLKLSNKSGAVLNRIIDKISELNRITEKDLEDIAKN